MGKPEKKFKKKYSVLIWGRCADDGNWNKDVPTSLMVLWELRTKKIKFNFSPLKKRNKLYVQSLLTRI